MIVVSVCVSIGVSDGTAVGISVGTIVGVGISTTVGTLVDTISGDYNNDNFKYNYSCLIYGMIIDVSYFYNMW